MNEPRGEDLLQAEQLGRLKAERLDADLRAAEQRERELCLARLVWEGAGGELAAPALSGGGGGGLGGSWGGGEGASTSEVWRLRQDVERLAAFHQAVQRSRAWRLVQWLRRPLGRAW
jgi:hypothetical protein